ncbi:MAG: ROK family protein [Bacteroidetes bacterium]|nr:MAG: ROK family protein [Bacteroidota bacterium]
MKPLWGIDLGGTKVEGIVVDADAQYHTLARLRVPTEQEHGYQHILGQMHKLIGMLAAETGLTPSRIGIGTPGALDPDSHTLKNSNTVCLIGQPLKKDLETLTGLQVLMANDANCFALAEARAGAAAEKAPGAEMIFGVIMGTGVGGGVVANGKVINGRHSIGGEWGHNFLDESGGPCYCGRIGCVETILSGPSSERWYLKLTGNKLKLKEIYQRYLDKSDPAATETIERLIHFFGKALGPIINILDPEAIVLGGGVSNLDVLYNEGAREVEKYVFNPRMETLILRPKMGDSAGVFGAAMLTE